jgi:hypothetical protein
MTNKNKYPKVKAIGGLYKAYGSEDDDYSGDDDYYEDDYEEEDDYSDDDYEDDYDAENYDNENDNSEYDDYYINEYGEIVDSDGTIYDEEGNEIGYYDGQGDYVDNEGTIFDNDGNVVGHYTDDGNFVDADGVIYDEEGYPIGYEDKGNGDFIDTDGLVYDKNGEFKGYYDNNGHFVDLNGVTYNKDGNVVEDKVIPNPPCPQPKTASSPKPTNGKTGTGANVGSPSLKQDIAKSALDLAKKKLESFSSKGLPPNSNQNSEKIYNDKLKQLQNELAKAQEQAKAVGVTPSWVLPVAIIGGILIVGLIVIIVVKNKK